MPFFPPLPPPRDTSYTMPARPPSYGSTILTLPDEPRRGQNSNRNPGGPQTQYVNLNPFQGMGYGGPIGGMNAPLYGGAAIPINVGTVGGYTMAPGAQEAQYRRAYQAAQAANQARYNDLVGTSAGLPIGVRNGKPVVQIGGQWVPQSEVSQEQLNRAVAQNSNFANALGGYYGRYARGMTGVEALMDDGGERYQGRYQRGMANVNAIDPLINEITGGYQERFNRNMGYLDQFSGQEEKDINSHYNGLLSKMRAEKAMSGLSSSTVVDNLASGIERDRQAALARLKDRRLEQRLATDSALSGDTLGFRERQGIAQGDRRLRTDAALSGDEAQFWENARRLGIDVDSRLSGDLLRLIEGRTDRYPDPNIRLRMQGF